MHKTRYTINKILVNMLKITCILIIPPYQNLSFCNIFQTRAVACVLFMIANIDNSIKKINAKVSLITGGTIFIAQERVEYAVVNAVLIEDSLVAKSGNTDENRAFKGVQINCIIVITIVNIKLNNAVINFPIIKHPTHHQHLY